MCFFVIFRCWKNLDFDPKKPGIYGTKRWFGGPNLGSGRNFGRRRPAGRPPGRAGRPPGPRDLIFGEKSMFSSGFTGAHRCAHEVPKNAKNDAFYHSSGPRETGTKHWFWTSKKARKMGRNFRKIFGKIDIFSGPKSTFSSVNFGCTPSAKFIIFSRFGVSFLPRSGPLQPEQNLDFGPEKCPEKPRKNPGFWGGKIECLFRKKQKKIIKKWPFFGSRAARAGRPPDPPIFRVFTEQTLDFWPKMTKKIPGIT